MATGTLSPYPHLQFFDTNGNPLASGKLYTYDAGTSTPAATYTDVGLTIANANPIILNAAGRPAAGGTEVPVFLSPGASYRFVLTTSTGSTIWTQDNIQPQPSVNLEVQGVAGQALAAGSAVYLSDGSGGNIAGQWYLATAANAYSSTIPIVGMVPAAIAAGATGTIRQIGAIDGIGGLTVGNKYYISTTGGLLTDVSPANQRFMGIADTTTSLILNPSLPSTTNGIHTSVISSTDVGSLNNWTPGLIGDTLIEWNGASTFTPTGLFEGSAGQRVTIKNITAAQVITFPYLDAGSASSARWQNIITSGSTPVASGGSITFMHDGTNWKLIQHDQGAWITRTFSAGDYTGNNAMSWVVAAGDVGTNRWKVTGKTFDWQVTLATTTVGGVPDTELRVQVPNNYQLANVNDIQPCAYANDNGTIVNAIVGPASTTLMKVTKTSAPLNWLAATDTTSIYFRWSGEIS